MTRPPSLPTNIESLHMLIWQLFERIETLEKDYGELQAEHQVLQTEAKALKEENTRLKERLNQDSQNSHLPPSQDGYKKPKKNRQAQLPKEAKAKGGQVGHKGKTLEQVSEPDSHEVHLPQACSCCGRRLDPNEGYSLSKERRQVCDIPPVHLEVTEHRLGIMECCGQQHHGTFPDHVTASVQYGAGMKAWVNVLSVGYRLPLKQISQLLADSYGYAINSSTLMSYIKAGHDQLEATEASIKNHLNEASVVHVDETSLRCQSTLQWLHVASTAGYTYLFLHAKRGKEALKSRLSILPNYRGRLVHDCWQSYFDFTQANHALCGAHLLRELQACMEQDTVWARKMHRFLCELLQQSRSGPLSTPSSIRDSYDRILQQADEEEPPPVPSTRGRPKQSKGRNLHHRLKKHADAVLAFAFYEDVPFTNNQAERDIRCVKVKQKISGGFRTLHGAQHFTRIQAVISTLRKQNLPVLESFRKLFEGTKTVLI